jgi:hypothetical protein
MPVSDIFLPILVIFRNNYYDHNFRETFQILSILCRNTMLLFLGRHNKPNKKRFLPKLFSSKSTQTVTCSKHCLVYVFLHPSVLQYAVKTSNLWSSYDHYFRRFGPIFGGKIGVFLKSDVMIQFLHKLALFCSKTAGTSVTSGHKTMIKQL